MRLKKGDVFNESEVFDDPLTSKLTRRLTHARDFNQNGLDPEAAAVPSALSRVAEWAMVELSSRA